jgi:hypothetical protein
MNKGIKIAVLILGCLLVFTCIAAYAIAYVLQLPMHVDRRIANDIIVSDNWTELRSDSPMKVVHSFQSIDLRIEGAYVAFKDGNDNLYLPNGSIIKPKVEIGDSDGNWYEMEGGSYTAQPRPDGSEIMDIGIARFGTAGMTLPKDRTYNVVRIRSDVTFTCKSVIWHNYNLK